jgi:hypothetical protein
MREPAGNDIIILRKISYNMKNCIKFEDVKSEWMKNPDFRQAYQDLELEYEIALELIKARVNADLTPAEIAERMGTTNPSLHVWSLEERFQMLKRCFSMQKPQLNTCLYA